MGIGPIVGIRPITMVKPSSPAPDLSGVFAVEFRGQERDETYSPSHQRAARGLEDEEPEEASLLEGDQQNSEDLSFDSEGRPRSSQVSFFA